jgi:hypothetical protein
MFWFLLAATLYLAWRAVTEVRVGMFVLAGIAGTLGALARFEGLFVAPLVAVWVGLRWRGLTSARTRLLLGALAAAIVLPVAVTTAAVVSHARHKPWQIVRTNPVGRALAWVDSWSGADAEGTGRAASRVSAGERWNQYWEKATKAHHPLLGLLLVIGIAAWRRTYFRRDHLALWVLGLPLWVAIYVQLWFAGSIVSRYFMSAVILSLPFAALGIVTVSFWAARLTQRWGRGLSPRFLTAALAGLLMVAGYGDGVSGGPTRRTAAHQASTVAVPVDVPAVWHEEARRGPPRPARN